MVANGAPGEKKSRPGGVSRLWGLYLSSLEKRPLLTKSLSTGVISSTSNLIEQTLSTAAFSLADWAAFTLVGAVFIASSLHYWYLFLERVANSKAVTSRVRSKWGRVLVQIAVDQSVGASFINSGYFALHTIFLALLTGTVFPLPELGSSIWEKVSSRYVTMIISNAKLWPWVSFFNFSFVPMNLRVLVTNCVAVFWDYLMSKWCK
ncbi:unnamed protein product [Pylaiella littoralis]